MAPAPTAAPAAAVSLRKSRRTTPSAPWPGMPVVVGWVVEDISNLLCRSQAAANCRKTRGLGSAGALLCSRNGGSAPPIRRCRAYLGAGARSLRTVDDDPRLRRLLDALPGPVCRAFAWLSRPQAQFVRLPLGLLMMVGGVAGFLPILGFWMLPVGALLVGQDVPPLRRVTLGGLGRVQAWLDRRRARHGR